MTKHMQGNGLAVRDLNYEIKRGGSIQEDHG